MFLLLNRNTIPTIGTEKESPRGTYIVSSSTYIVNESIHYKKWQTMLKTLVGSCLIKLNVKW